MITDEEELTAICEKIIGAAFTVANVMGGGFAEKCYENALLHELKKAGLQVVQQQALKVYYDGVIVGEFIADLIVENSIVVELKAAKAIDAAHLAQCINYLAATNMPLCLLINFARRVEVRRIAGPALKARRASVPICDPSVARMD
jgi:GxxExxY protein